MMPDSTQCGNENKKVEKKKARKSCKNRKCLEELVVSDRRCLLDELLELVGKEELRRGLPSILQDVPFEELKVLCSEQLERMSNAEVLRILAGEDEAQPVNPTPDSTSADHELLEHSTAREPLAVHEARRSSPSPSESLELFPATEDMDLLVTGDARMTAAAAAANGKGSNAKVQDDAERRDAVAEQDDSPDIASNLTKMRMEILELELRARAIKALLLSQRGPEDETVEDGKGGGNEDEPMPQCEEEPTPPEPAPPPQKAEDP